MPRMFQISVERQRPLRYGRTPGFHTSDARLILVLRIASSYLRAIHEDENDMDEMES
jgi:hypothetical protein